MDQNHEINPSPQPAVTIIDAPVLGSNEEWLPYKGARIAFGNSALSVVPTKINGELEIGILKKQPDGKYKLVSGSNKIGAGQDSLEEVADLIKRGLETGNSPEQMFAMLSHGPEPLTPEELNQLYRKYKIKK